VKKQQRKNDHGQQQQHPSPQKVPECRFFFALYSAYHVAPRGLFEFIAGNIPDPSWRWQREKGFVIILTLAAAFPGSAGGPAGIFKICHSGLDPESRSFFLDPLLRGDDESAPCAHFTRFSPRTFYRFLSESCVVILVDLNADGRILGP
jgi:hypothetical protein